MYNRMRLQVQDLLNRMIDKWPPMLRLVVLASLPALGALGLVIAKSVLIRLRANNRGNRGCSSGKSTVLPSRGGKAMGSDLLTINHSFTSHRPGSGADVGRQSRHSERSSTWHTHPLN